MQNLHSDNEQYTSVIPSSLFVLGTLLLASAGSNNILLDNQYEGEKGERPIARPIIGPIAVTRPIQAARPNNTTFLSRLNAIAQYMTPNITSAMIQNLLNINNLFNKHTTNVTTLNEQLHKFAITADDNKICVNLSVKQEKKGKKQLVTQELTKTVENYMNLTKNTTLKNKLKNIDEIIDSNITNIAELNRKLQEFGIIITEDKICIKRSSSSVPLDLSTLEDNEVANAIEKVDAYIAVDTVNDIIAAADAKAVADAADAKAVADAADAKAVADAAAAAAAAAAADAKAVADAADAAQTKPKTKKKSIYRRIRGMRMPWSTRKRTP